MAGKTQKAPRAYLLWGQEELRKRSMLGELLDGLVPPQDRALDVQYIDATNSNVTDQSAGANATTDQSNRIGEESGEQSGKHPCLWDWNVGYADLDQSNSALTVADAGNENWTGQMVGQVQQVNAGR